MFVAELCARAASLELARLLLNISNIVVSGTRYYNMLFCNIHLQVISTNLLNLLNQFAATCNFGASQAFE